MPPFPLEWTVAEVHARIGSGEPIRLIDVREPEEIPLAGIDGAQLIPMGHIPALLREFEDRDGALVFFCHHGVRSLRVAAWLRERGVENAISMQGGIDAWSRFVDTEVPRY